MNSQNISAERSTLEKQRNDLSNQNIGTDKRNLPDRKVKKTEKTKRQIFYQIKIFEQRKGLSRKVIVNV